MDKARIAKQKARYTVHALRDYFLGGYNAVLKRDGVVVYRSPGNFWGRNNALRRARVELHNKFRTN